MRVSIALARKLLLALCVTVVLAAIPSILRADNGSATLTVTVIDSSGAVIPSAVVILRNVATDQRESVNTDGRGSLTFPFLKPAQYAVLVQKPGFNEVSVNDIVLSVGDNRELQVVMKVGSARQTVRVDGSGLTINTTDGSVSTVIDRKFVQNIPLNGRSFQGLILLTPGSITNSPQTSSRVGYSGEFSIDGQRTESNYYTVDGVSANVASPTGANAAAGGSLPASTALGTTQSLVSVDALQEFRVDSSTYSAEYGRSPGGQFSMVTRSGTNHWHGTTFDYFRNDALDANSWFNDNTVPITKKTAERQNDFGGTLGGPIRIPYLYNGVDHSFFFFSYEGLRLVQPSPATVNAVPDLTLRQSATGALQEALDAYPLPTPGYPDLVSGMGQFVGAWSHPSQADSTSIRLDQTIGQRLHMFFRFSNTPSSAASRGTSAAYGTPSVIYSNAYTARTYTLGTTATLSQRITNDFRLNFTTNDGINRYTDDTFGGAKPVDLFSLQGISSANSLIAVSLGFGGYYPELEESGALTGQQKQWNVVDTLAIEHGRHFLKVGMDWRRLTPTIPVEDSYPSYTFSSAAAVTANSVSSGAGRSYAAENPLYLNFSAFAQDEWKASSRFNISMGVRWDVNPAPSVTRGLKPYTVSGLSDIATMTLAPQGTSLWKTDWFSIAPRLGVAYVLHSDANWETVFRSGGGVFFDTGQQTGSYGFQGPGFSATNLFGASYSKPASFPVAPALVTPTITNPPTSPYTYIFANPQHLQLPYTLQWSASIEQALGRSQTFTISYVGANGRKLLREDFASISKINPNFGYLYVFTNGLTSSYNALQVKFQRQVVRGLQVLGSYTWSHALDYGSYSAAFPYEHGNSDLDVRHNATAAVSYDLPHKVGSPLVRALTSDWGIDGRLTARTGFPVTLNGNSYVDPATEATIYGGLNRVANAPLFLYGGEYPGGRRINPEAFTVPLTGQPGNAPRNFVTGFGAIQGDVAIRRSFGIYDNLRGELRAEAFNVANHPNFGLIGATCGGAIGATCSNVQFGLATQILAQSLGTLSPLYQMGGPRSLQINFKLIF